MASIYQLKKKFQGLLRPLVGKLASIGVTANQVTIAACVLSIVGGGIMARYPGESWPWLLLPVILFVRMALNAVDGMLAREHNMKSNLGAVLNEIGDVVSDTILYLPFVLVAGSSGWMVVTICLIAIISEMTGVVGVQIGASRRYDGPMGKSDRAFAFGILGLLIGLKINLGVWMDIYLIAMMLLLVFTTINRARQAIREASHA